MLAHKGAATSTARLILGRSCKENKIGHLMKYGMLLTTGKPCI